MPQSVVVATLVAAVSLPPSLTSSVFVAPHVLRPSVTTTDATPAEHPIAIRHPRLEASTTREYQESTILKFDVENESDTSQTDIELSVSLLGPIDGGEEERPVLVRPFTIRVDTVLPAGYSLEYEIRLRNIRSDCDCVPKIDILNARAVVEETN
jgi:hypothetical protein